MATDCGIFDELLDEPAEEGQLHQYSQDFEESESVNTQHATEYFFETLRQAATLSRVEVASSAHTDHRTRLHELQPSSEDLQESSHSQDHRPVVPDALFVSVIEASTSTHSPYSGKIAATLRSLGAVGRERERALILQQISQQHTPLRVAAVRPETLASNIESYLAKMLERMVSDVQPVSFL